MNITVIGFGYVGLVSAMKWRMMQTGTKVGTQVIIYNQQMTTLRDIKGE